MTTSVRSAPCDRLTDPDLRRPATQRVLALSEADLGPGMPDVYLRQVNDNQSLQADFSLVSAHQFARDRTRIEASLGLLERAIPDLAGEVRALAPEIVVVTSRGADGFEFHGASSFHLWGSILVNAEAHQTRLKLAEVIAHESGHALLHGAALGRPIVSNAPDQLYSSPLRHDPRPMEGIVHATYVLARMHFTMASLLASGELDRDEEKAAAEYMADFSGWYAEGLGVVQAHAEIHRRRRAAFRWRRPLHGGPFEMSEPFSGPASARARDRGTGALPLPS